MKTKLLVAALGLIASAAQAAIVPTTTVGGSDLLLNVWEQNAAGGAPDQSFTFDLGFTFTQFVNNQSMASANFATLNAATDTIWANFLSTSSLPDLKWAVIASGNKVPTTRPAILTTVTAGTDPTMGGGLQTQSGNDTINANTQISTFISNLNIQANPNEQIGTAPSLTYFQQRNLQTLNANAWENSSAIGATAGLASATYAAGNPATAPSAFQYFGNLTFAQTGSTYALNYNVSAVPEPSAFAMVLAGFGAVALMVRRNRRIND